MSDEEYRGPALLHLPGDVCRDIADNGGAPEGWVFVALFRFSLPGSLRCGADDRGESGRELVETRCASPLLGVGVLRRICREAIRGKPPFNLNRAADHLESLARNDLERDPPLPLGRTPLLFCNFSAFFRRMLPHPGPAVGPGVTGRRGDLVTQYEPATGLKMFVYLTLLPCQGPK